MPLRVHYVGLGMFVLNTENFGYILRPEDFKKLEQLTKAFLNFKLQTLGKPTLWVQVRYYYGGMNCQEYTSLL